jgi:cysteine desulfurase
MASSPLVYLDNNATTCVDPQVVEALIPYLTQHFGNASSSYALGRDAKAAVNHARDQVARMLQAQEAEEIIFLSGNTKILMLGIEYNNI